LVSSENELKQLDKQHLTLEKCSTDIEQFVPEGDTNILLMDDPAIFKRVTQSLGENSFVLLHTKEKAGLDFYPENYVKIAQKYSRDSTFILLKKVQIFSKIATFLIPNLSFWAITDFWVLLSFWLFLGFWVTLLHSFPIKLIKKSN
jgi:hypothetical protein